MSAHNYPAAVMVKEYVRVILGLILTVGPIMFAQPLAAVEIILGCFAILFAAYGVRTLLRQFTRVELSAQGLRLTGPLAAEVTWSAIEKVELRYYSTRRDRTGGWMQLKVRAGRRQFAFDSAISDFATLAATVISEAQRAGGAIGAATLTNLDALLGRRTS